MIQILAALAILWAILPFLWALITSLKTGSDLHRLELLPNRITFDNYTSIFREQHFGENIFNSVAVAGTTVLISLSLSILASYAIARRRFNGRRLLLFSFLMVSMFPQIAILSGLFELLRSLGLFNRRSGLVLCYSVFTLPFTVWTLTVFMREIPKSIEESATIDGAHPLLIIWRIFVPLLAPSLITTSLLAFIAAWNEFLFALSFTLTENARTVPVAVAMMSGASEHEIPWGRIMAASVVTTIPVIAIVLVLQRRIVSGLTQGALKG